MLDKHPILLGVTADLGLRFPETAEAWWQQVRAEVPAGLRREFRRLRRQRDAGRIGEAPFYRLLADPALARLMIEGRLGYYNAVLPALAKAIEQVPHARIADLGAFGGILTFCLARLFPESQVVGVERLRPWVMRSKEFQDRLGLPNVTFLHADYRAYVPAARFDVVVSISALPTAGLPVVSSESPRSHRRGRMLADMVNTDTRPVRRMASCLSALPGLVKPQGRVMAHERACDPGVGLLLYFLACQAKLAMTGSTQVTWSTAAESGGPARAPLVILEPRTEPVLFDEAMFLPLFFEASGSMPLYAPPRVEVLKCFGPEAEGRYESLPHPRITVRCEQWDPDGQWWDIEFGKATEGPHYLYVCNTSDYRELRLCDLPAMHKVIDESIAYLGGLGYSYRVRPDSEELKAQLAQVFPRST